ncbi:hypothetical protein KFL_010050010 [Klebsormidium nitens]|uniref:Uncharacterized protein n=1 Tax=Klebsormidium nitens TaxID=105231 RepID=A0A1Y1INC7_KLENI|nr:hypothetical protein KFL_010050010 [Klebsormidium nitens]|eukprot:GAQ92395.1 hypothetical protein KFL_010050010 [Klebsormidium nitens]
MLGGTEGFLVKSTTSQRKHQRLVCARASSLRSEEPSDDGDYALPPLDFEDLMGGAARHAQAQKAKQEKNDAALLENWDDSPLAKESTYNMLGARGGQSMAREFQGEWKSVDPASFLAKLGMQSPAEGKQLDERLSAGDDLADWSEPIRERQVAPREGAGQKPGQGTGVKKRSPDGGERGTGFSGRVSDKPERGDDQGRRGGVASVSGRGEGALRLPQKLGGSGVRGTRKVSNTWQELQARPSQGAFANGIAGGGNAANTKIESELSPQERDAPSGAMGGGEKQVSSEAGRAPPEKNAPSFDQWDLGLPDYDLVKEYMKEAPPGPQGGPQKSEILTPPVMPSEFSQEPSPSYGAAFTNEEGEETGERGLGELAMSQEELAAKARAIEGRLRNGFGGGMNGQSGVGSPGNANRGPAREGKVPGGLDDIARGGSPNSSVAEDVEIGKATDVDDDSLLAQFDQMMASKQNWMPDDVRDSDLGGSEDVLPKRGGKSGAVGKGGKKQRGHSREDFDDDEDFETEEALRRTEELLRGKSDAGLMPEARARLEEERRLDSMVGDEDEESDEDEEIEEQFIQDPDWQDGWGDDMYMDLDEEMKKAKAERAAKKAKQGTRDIIDLTRGNEPLAGKLNRDGSLSIEGSQKGQGAGRAVRGIESLSSGSGRKSRKPVDVEKEKRDSEEFIATLQRRAEERKTGGRKKRAIPDTGSLWETPEMVAERRKDMALDSLEEELEEEEIMLEQRAERVAKEFSLIDSVVKGEFEDEELELEALLADDALLEMSDDVSGAHVEGSDREVVGRSAKHEEEREREEEERRKEEERKRLEERRRAEESLSIGGFWADLDDEPIPSTARTVGNAKVERKAPSSKESDAQRSHVEKREAVELTSGIAGSAVASEKRQIPGVPSETGNTSGGQNEKGRGAEREAGNGPESSSQQLDQLPGSSDGAMVAKEPVTRDGGFGETVEAPEKQTLLEQLRPQRLRRREEPKEETVESVIKGYPELEFTEEVDPETGVVRQVIRHVGLPPGEIAAEERREAERLAQSLNIETDEAAQANMLVDRMLVAGERVEEMITQLGREKRLDTQILRAIDRKMGIARKNKADKAIETLDILYKYIEAEMERQNASPALRLLDELLQLDDGALDEATWLRLCRDRMRAEFVPESAIDIFNPPGVPKPRADGTWEYPEDDEGILRIDFVREIDDLLEDLAQQEREFARASGYTAEAIAARLVIEQRMRTAAQLRKLKRNAAMIEV